MVLVLDLEVPRLPIAVLEHRALDLDRRFVPEPGVVPAGSPEFEPALLRHSLLTDRAEVVGAFTPVHDSRSFLGGTVSAPVAPSSNAPRSPRDCALECH